jgi:flagellar hook-associated protein 2
MSSSLGTVTTTTGLLSGVDYQSLVESLLEISAKPRDNLVTRINTMQSESTAVTTLMALLASVEYVTDNLGKSEIFSARTASSSNSNVLTAAVTGTPALGTYQFTAVRAAQSQQMMSGGYAKTTTTLGAGTFSFRYGDDLTSTQALDLINGGAGFTRGKIRITDRSGAASTIDLSTASSLEDVVTAINDDETIDVTAELHGDSIRLIDETGVSTSNLKVAEVGSGQTAASLGLAGIDVAASSVDGSDLLSLSRDMSLSSLNDGLGVQFNTSLADIKYTLADGTTGEIDLSPLLSGGSTVDADETLGDVIDRINAIDPTKLQARISTDGDHLEIVDLTTGSGEFTLTSLYDSKALSSLGLDGATAAGGVIQSGRLLGGLGTALLSRLNGGSGLGALGTLQLTDSSGATATVDLSAAQTVDDVLDAINASGTGITAALNDNATGIVLTDSSTGTGNLIVANGGDGLTTADKLQLAVNSQVDSVDSGDLHLAVVSWGTELADLNGGSGVAQGAFTITDSAGKSATITVDDDVTTLGDVITEINRTSIGVTASLNSTGDGILVTDTAGGTATLSVAEGATTTAADLHLLATATTNTDGDQIVNGSMTYTVALDADDTLTDLKDKINALDAGLQASIFSDGSSKPYRLSLSSETTGNAGRFVFASSGISLALSETVEAQDAVLCMGSTSSTSSTLLKSSTNTFGEVITGLSLTVKSASTSPVTITVSSSSSNLKASLETFVSNYNTFVEQLDEYTAFNSETNSGSILSGDSAALRLDSDLPKLLSGLFLSSDSSIRSLTQLGVTLEDDGTLTFDEDTFDTAFEADADGVEAFFTNEETGFSDKFHTLLEQLAGEDDSLLSLRIESLTEKIERNQEKVEWYNERLEAESEAMYLKFYRMELAIAELQDSLSVVEAIEPLDPYTGASS